MWRPHDGAFQRSGRRCPGDKGLPHNFHRLTDRRRELLRLLLEPEHTSRASAFVDDIVALSVLGLIEVDPQGSVNVTPKGLAEAKQPSAG